MDVKVTFKQKYWNITPYVYQKHVLHMENFHTPWGSGVGAPDGDS